MYLFFVTVPEIFKSYYDITLHYDTTTEMTEKTMNRSTANSAMFTKDAETLSPLGPLAVVL